MDEPKSSTLIPLPATGYAKAGAVLGQAFHDDPLWMETFPDPDTRPDLLVAMFTGLARATVAAQGVVETSQQLEAVALWMPPGKSLGLMATVKSRFALPRFMMGLPADDRKRMLPVLRQLKERSKVLMPDPHWYLSAIGVSPESQGEGLGSALVRSGLSKADAANVAVYLETETEANVGFYQHLGFGVVEQITAAGLDLPLWLMARPPSAPGK